MFIKSTSLIIPTKERVSSLKKLFFSIKDYISEFNEILIIDSSEKFTHESLIRNFKLYKNLKIFKSDPSSSVQRNIGMKNRNKNNKFIMFCDDDIVFEQNSIKIIDKFISNNLKSIGYGFNLIEKDKSDFLEKIKKNKFFIKNKLYDLEPGIVCQNGWHTKLVNVKKDCNTMWLSTQACVYQSSLLQNILFDETLGKYSYLEDLFFSYELHKRGSLSLCHEAKYFHLNNIDRKNIKFGIKEVVNRHKFVKKNNLVSYKFYITILLKILLNLVKVLTLRLNLLPKLIGNLIGLILCTIRR